MADFYIYQHRETDTGRIFYVGKGHGKRLGRLINRNSDWHDIVDKHGFKAEIIADGLEEELALLAEQEAIDVYRRRGILLVNRTSGGQGSSGYRHTEKTRAKMAASGRVKIFSETHRKNLSLAHAKRIITEETRKKLSIASKANAGKYGWKIGVKHSDSSRQKMSDSLKASWKKPEVREKRAAAQKKRFSKTGGERA